MSSNILSITTEETKVSQEQGLEWIKENPDKAMELINILQKNLSQIKSNNIVLQLESIKNSKKTLPRSLGVFGLLSSTYFVDPLVSIIGSFVYYLCIKAVDFDNTFGGERWFLLLLITITTFYLTFLIITYIFSYKLYGKETAVGIMNKFAEEGNSCIRNLLPEFESVLKQKTSYTEETKLLKTTVPVVGYISAGVENVKSALNYYSVISSMSSYFPNLQPIAQKLSEIIYDNTPEMLLPLIQQQTKNSTISTSKELVIYNSKDLIKDFHNISQTLNNSLIVMFGDRFGKDALLDNLWELVSIENLNRIIQPTKILSDSKKYLDDIQYNPNSWINNQTKAVQETVINLGMSNGVNQDTIHNINSKIEQCSVNLVNGIRAELSTTEEKISNNSIYNLATSSSLISYTYILLILWVFVIMFKKIKRKK